MRERWDDGCLNCEDGMGLHESVKLRLICFDDGGV
jgi:hypothetical protein